MEDENDIMNRGLDEKNREDIEGEENLEEEMYNENENENNNVNDGEEEEHIEEEIISPSNELNNQIVEQHDKNQNIEEQNNQQKLNKLKEEIENITDSDIDDPKYKPYNRQNKKKTNIDNNLLNLQQKIIFLQNNNNFLNKSLKEYEMENKLLKSEIMKKNTILKSKEDLVKEYQNLLSVFKDKVTQSENYNKTFKKQIDDLKNELNEKDNLISQYKKQNNLNEINAKSIPSYTEQFNEIESKFNDREKQIQEKYSEKEKKLIKDFMEKK